MRRKNRKKDQTKPDKIKYEMQKDIPYRKRDETENGMQQHKGLLLP